MSALLISAAAFASTMMGGLLALKLRDRMHLVLGFSAGAVVAVSFFDLLPEAIQLGSASYDAATILSAAALGFLAYLVLDRLILLGHSHGETDHDAEFRGHVRAGSFSVHSLLDGVGIGLAFQVSPAVGIIVAVAVLAHDFSDGINTVNVLIHHGVDQAKALRWLLADALAPIIGVIATLFFSIPPAALGMSLALFAGFFLYIGASDLIPESHHQHPKFLTTAMTVLGMAALYFVIQLAS